MVRSGARELPMFPLGSVLVPGVVLPLHVFEPRFRTLVSTVLGTDGEFGVVLIERGSEVGGGEVRTDVGCVAKVARAEELADGRWAVIAVGDRRIRVRDWLPDDPHPRAIVEDWPDDPGESDRAASLYEAATSMLHTALALAGELGQPVAPIDSSLPDDPTAGSYAVVALAPIGPLDQQRLLSAPGPVDRLELFESIAAEQIGMLRAQLQLGDG